MVAVYFTTDAECRCGRPRWKPEELSRWIAIDAAGCRNDREAIRWHNAICWALGPTDECTLIHVDSCLR